MDDALPVEERQAVRQHLSACHACTRESSEQQRIREAMRSLPRRTAPPDLTMRLRVAASKARMETRGPGRWSRLKDRVELTLSNLMRPLALPAAGGLCSALFLFAALAPAFTPTFAMMRQSSPWDVPTMLSTQPMVKYVAPVAFGGDAVVDLSLDDHGCMIGYTIVSSSTGDTEQLRRSIENNLLFTEFWPATAFGVPVAGSIRISYRSPAGIDVKG